MLIKRRKGWEIPERAVTPEHVYLNRRQILRAAGFAGIGGGLVGGGLALPARALAQSEDFSPPDDPTRDLYPVATNPEFADAGRPLSSYEDAATYNNFYEYGSHKEIWGAAQELQIRPWTVTFDGLVEEERTVDIDTLIRAMPLEERIYRHRCVEAWSMVVPWSGFAMRHLIDYARPLGDARYIRMETFQNDSAPGFSQFWYPWPYVEGLTMAEAMNDLTFMVTGLYGRPLPKQNGSPIRLHTPWKFGFKSLKSIVRITFTDEQPLGFWEELQPSEYGFWANVNPEVPHPRWSQATERVLGSDERIPTLLYNGYGEYVADMYAGMEAELGIWLYR